MLLLRGLLLSLSLSSIDRKYYANTDDDGSESVVSCASVESEGDEQNHHLLTTPNGDVAFLKEKPVRLARELM